MIKTLLLFVLSVVFISCTKVNKFDESRERQNIMELHNLQRKYHFEKLPEELVSQLSKNFISINNGEISSPTFEENLNRFKNYFKAVDFVKWDDIAPPVIRFSADGNMAYSAVNKEVIIKYKNGENKLVQERTIFAWLTIYRKYGDNWKIDCITSTNKPGETTKI